MRGFIVAQCHGRRLAVTLCVSALFLHGCMTAPPDTNGNMNNNGGNTNHNTNVNNNDNTNSNSSQATAVLGFTNPTTTAFQVIGHGETMPLFTGGQGGSHLFVTIRATGFPRSADDSATIRVAQFVELGATGQELHNFEQAVRFAPLSDDTSEVASRFVFLDAVPSSLDGELANLAFELTSTTDDQVSVTIMQTVVLDLQE